jgi:hypothetical protein
VAEKRARKGHVDENHRVVWKPLEISSNKKFSDITAYEYIYGKFCNDPKMEDLYKKHRNSYFRSIDRIKLIQVSPCRPE